MPFLTTNSARIFYEEHGSGTPVVMLHSTLHDRRDFALVADRLSSRFRTIAVDWPGHGWSEAPAGANVDAPLLADTLEDLAWELSLPPAVYIGNSVGGYAAARLAIRYPERVAALVLVNTAGFAKLTTLGRTFAHLLGVPSVNRRLLFRLVRGYMKPRNDTDRAVTERVVATARTTDGSNTAATLWKSFTARDFSLREHAGEIQVPTLLVWGAQDTLLPLKAGQQTHAAIPGSRLEVLDTGHVVFASEPDRFLALVEPFIERASCRQ